MWVLASLCVSVLPSLSLFPGANQVLSISQNEEANFDVPMPTNRLDDDLNEATLVILTTLYSPKQKSDFRSDLGSQERKLYGRSMGHRFLIHRNSS